MLSVPHLAVSANVIIVILVPQIVGVLALILRADDISQNAAVTRGHDGNLTGCHRCRPVRRRADGPVIRPGNEIAIVDIYRFPRVVSIAVLFIAADGVAVCPYRARVFCICLVESQGKDQRTDEHAETGEVQEFVEQG